MEPINRCAVVHTFILLVFFFILDIKFSVGTSVVGCNENERKALLTFKQHLIDPYINTLSSWNDTAGNDKDCCRWEGVVCNNKTDDPQSVNVFVHELHLGSTQLGGELSPSLLELKHLKYLDLSGNYLNNSIPAFLGSLRSLKYLDLSYNGFVGKIPPQLGNLSSLTHLDLSSRKLADDDLEQFTQHMTESAFSYPKLNSDDLEWITKLSSLEYLEMSFLNLSKASDRWFHSINSLPSLKELRLPYCGLKSLPTLSYLNFTSLRILDLSSNHITSFLPEWLYNLTNLEHLNLAYNVFQGKYLVGERRRTFGDLCNLQTLHLTESNLQGELSGFLGNLSGCTASSLKSIRLPYNQLSGPLPDQLGRLKNLEYLFLMENSISGSIPSSLGRLSVLKMLDLSDNKLSGSLPQSLGQLSNLEHLRISNNAFQGIVTETHFANLSSLTRLEMSSVSLKLSADWVPPFQLEVANLGTCQLGPQFPQWLFTQKNIVKVNISKTGISGKLPAQLLSMSSKVKYLDLSYNQFNGKLPKLLQIKGSTVWEVLIDLSSNRFEGQLPYISSNIVKLDLSNNSISGPISVLLCNPLSEHNILEVLDLSGNLLSGELSDCWDSWMNLAVLKLESNNITGKIPSSFGSLRRLQSIHLRNNSLFGEVPSSFQDFTHLQVVDLGENAFTGSISTWIGVFHPYFVSLSLSSNKFYGAIPRELCHLHSLQLLDLAHNNLSGSIPKCFRNLSAMVSNHQDSASDVLPGFAVSGSWVEKGYLVTKGRQNEYGKKQLALVKGMDLSQNNLSGEIPEELTSLFGLQSLNLSENHFTGKIPNKIGQMNSLESLDFSKNMLSGSIPQSMTNLTFLGILNLSYNNLSGKIPVSTQLQSFQESSYVGNQGLCGPPLKNCFEEEKEKHQPAGDGESGPKEDEFEEWLEKNCFYISLILGSAIGFWGFWGVLVVKKAWRFAYFRFLDDMMIKFRKT